MVTVVVGGSIVEASLCRSLMFASVHVTKVRGVDVGAAAMVSYNLLEDNGHKAHSGDGT